MLLAAASLLSMLSSTKQQQAWGSNAPPGSSGVPGAGKRPHVLSARRKKLHVLCERPLALSSRGIDRCLAAAEKADVRLVVAGNFISSSDAGSGAPIDSFMVYVGAPVADTVGAAWTGSDGSTHPVFDPVRRWFGELGGDPLALESLRFDFRHFYRREFDLLHRFGEQPVGGRVSHPCHGTASVLQSNGQREHHHTAEQRC